MNKDTRLPPKGMRDIDPLFADIRERTVRKIVDVYRAYGFSSIETPALEKLENLIGQKGGENEKLIFKILRRGLDLAAVPAPLNEDDLVDFGLRYDLTVPLSRFYANNAANLPKPFKVIQIGSVWRAERPQKGRYRQFTQCDIDILGDPSPTADVELIYVNCSALKSLGLSEFDVRINDRRLLERMAGFCGLDGEHYRSFLIALDKIDKKSMAEILSELAEKGIEAARLKKVDDMLAAVASLRGDIPAVAAYLKIEPNWPVTAELARIVATVKNLLKDDSIIRFDPTLVRGMDYYTGPIYEVAKRGGTSSVAGGGRYDRMIGGYLGQDVPACGFSIGFERIVDELLEKNSAAASAESKKVALFYSEGQDNYEDAFRYADKLRSDGYLVSLIAKAKNFSNQLEKLRSIGVRQYAVFSADLQKINLTALERI